MIGCDIVIQLISENTTILIPPLNDGISQCYYININGDIYSTLTNKYLTPQLSENGYLQVHLKTDTGYVIRKLHRLVMMSFCYFLGCENFQVNHKDGNKLNNKLYNLEWATPKYNVEHAIKNNLRSSYKGESNPNAKISERTAVNIINLLLKGYGDNVISDKLKVPVSIIQEIAKCNTWRHLTFNIKDELLKTRAGHRLSEDEYHCICKYFQDNKDNYPKQHGSVKKIVIDSLESIGVQPTDTFIRIAKRLYYRYDRKDINSLYDY